MRQQREQEGERLALGMAGRGRCQRVGLPDGADENTGHS